MRQKIISILTALNPNNPLEIVHAMTVGFLVGIAFSAANPNLATSIHFGLLNEWRDDGNNSKDYGPRGMAEVLLKELKG